MNLRLVPVLVLLAAAAPLAQALPMPPFTEWTFEGLSTSGVNTSPPTATGTGTASSVGMALVTGPDNSGIAKQQGTDGNNDSTSNLEWKVRGTNGWSASAGLATQGAQFLTSTVGYTDIVASFDWYPSTQGEANLVVQYTLNGTSWIDATAAQLTVPTSATLALNNNAADPNTVTGAYLTATAGNTWYNQISLNLSQVSGAANDPTFGIRLMNASTGADVVQANAGAAFSSTSGNWSFDDVAFNGTAIPEPSSYALVLGLAAIGALLVRRRRAARA